MQVLLWLVYENLISESTQACLRVSTMKRFNYFVKRRQQKLTGAAPLKPPFSVSVGVTEEALGLKGL